MWHSFVLWWYNIKKFVSVKHNYICRTADQHVHASYKMFVMFDKNCARVGLLFYSSSNYVLGMNNINNYI
jgi:hypothetical protein